MTWVGSWLCAKAWKEVMGRGVLLSRRVKFCCCRLATGSPDLGVTTTSRTIFPDGEGVATGVCWAAAQTAESSEAQKTKEVRRYVCLDMRPPCSERRLSL